MLEEVEILLKDIIGVLSSQIHDFTTFCEWLNEAILAQAEHASFSSSLAWILLRSIRIKVRVRKLSEKNECQNFPNEISWRKDDGGRSIIILTLAEELGAFTTSKGFLFSWLKSCELCSIGFPI